MCLLRHDITLTIPTAGPKTNKQHRLNKQYSCDTCEVNVDQVERKIPCLPRNHTATKHPDPAEIFPYFLCQAVRQDWNSFGHGSCCLRQINALQALRVPVCLFQKEEIWYKNKIHQAGICSLLDVCRLLHKFVLSLLFTCAWVMFQPCNYFMTERIWVTKLRGKKVLTN